MTCANETLSVLSVLDGSVDPFWTEAHMEREFPANRQAASVVAARRRASGVDQATVDRQLLAAVSEETEKHGVRLRRRSSKNADMIIRTKTGLPSSRGDRVWLDAVVPTRMMSNDELRAVQEAFHRQNVAVIVTADQSLRVLRTARPSKNELRASELHLELRYWDHLSSAIRTVEYLLERDVRLTVASQRDVVRGLISRCSSMHVQKTFEIAAVALRSLPLDADSETVGQVYGMLEAALRVLERRSVDRGRELIEGAVEALMASLSVVYASDG